MRLPRSVADAREACPEHGERKARATEYGQFRDPAFLAGEKHSGYGADARCAARQIAHRRGSEGGSANGLDRRRRTLDFAAWRVPDRALSGKTGGGRLVREMAVPKAGAPDRARLIKTCTAVHFWHHPLIPPMQRRTNGAERVASSKT